ncbi:DUF222 domain-containing protein, partial [Spirillospora sp. NPDC048832]
MSLIAADLDAASTVELVDAVTAIAAKLASRAAPDSPSTCLELAETVAADVDLLEAALAGFVGVVDGAREVQRWGFPSTRSWLRSRMGMRESRAKERLTLARQRHRLTEVTGRWTAGELSTGYAATIAEATTRLDDDDRPAAEDILLSMVDKGFSAGKVASFGKRIRDVIAERDGREQE